MGFDMLQMHALTYITHIYSDMMFLTRCRCSQHVICWFFCGTERCYHLAGCSACELNVSMGFGVMEATLPNNLRLTRHLCATCALPNRVDKQHSESPRGNCCSWLPFSWSDPRQRQPIYHIDQLTIILESDPRMLGQRTHRTIASQCCHADSGRLVSPAHAEHA